MDAKNEWCLCKGSFICYSERKWAKEAKGYIKLNNDWFEKYTAGNERVQKYEEVYPNERKLIPVHHYFSHEQNKQIWWTYASDQASKSLSTTWAINIQLNPNTWQT